ncbi:MAG TPA: right-handed parallel beta-helix repeat-containing protein [Gemmatimonadaceae bacterium]|nr:right-handed parallel beta-helix repeat-containing protein [Gemmatimonadaceae bacterium]
MRPVGLLLCVCAVSLPAQVPTVELRPGLVITRSVRVAPRTYRLPAPASLDSAVIVVRGDGITVDLSGATLVGAPEGADPDAGAGVAIRVEGGRNVRITNGRIRGYKVGILARGTRGLTLADNDLSDNWKPRLFSLVEHESLVDWLSYHRNEKDEWLRFGAAAYLADVKGGEIRGNRVQRGMNGVLLVRSDSLRIWNNVITFNSGIGFGLYRSSDNLITHNHADYNVRGYSHGFYRRGQDSAALLMYEQSCRNVVAYNSMTHSGDGLFLWAGQSTMDTGQGGANDNVFVGNDFSYAPTNGMEATFSRNVFLANRIEGSDHGLWGGYSFESKVVGNDFRRNRIGIAIEHGQHNEIARNRFVGDTTAISLWANPIEPSDWGYPRHRDTRSRDYRIAENTFVGQRVVYRVRATRGVSLTSNRVVGADSVHVLADTAGWTESGDVRDGAPVSAEPLTLEARLAALPPDLARLVPARIQGGLHPDSAPLARRERSDIVVTEWGPYDWTAPLLWPVDSTRARPLRLRVVGPAGRWRVVGRRGVASVSRESGRTGDTREDTIAVTPARDGASDWELTLEHRAPVTGGPEAVRRFSYGRFEPPVDWHVSFFTWTDSMADPVRNLEAFAAVLRGTPVITRQAGRLDYMWYRPTMPGLPQERFAIEATGSVTLGAGTYTLRTISDDGVRVWVDGRLAIDSWTPHESKVDHVSLGAGRHDIRVQYYQLRGWTELRLEILRGVHRSEGSPGPH